MISSGCLKVGRVALATLSLLLSAVLPVPSLRAQALPPLDAVRAADGSMSPPGGTRHGASLRAIGPSLAALGVTDALVDPFLELHDSNGAVVASNDNWQDSADKQVFIDNGIAPTSDKESIILGTLVPGNYTAIVSGVGGGTGVGLVEAYNLQ